MLILPFTRFNFRTYRWMQTMIFAIEEINREGNLLPNITVGYKIYDSCSLPHQALKAAVELMAKENNSYTEEKTQNNGACHGSVPVVIGDGGSTQSLVVAHFLGVFHVPQVNSSELQYCTSLVLCRQNKAARCRVFFLFVHNHLLNNLCCS